MGSSFNLFIFVDNSELEKKLYFKGRLICFTVVNSIDTDRRMRLRLKI